MVTSCIVSRYILRINTRPRGKRQTRLNPTGEKTYELRTLRFRLPMINVHRSDKMITRFFFLYEKKKLWIVCE